MINTRQSRRSFMQHSAAALIINLTGFGQRQATGAAVKQLYLQLIFQFRDLTAKPFGVTHTHGYCRSNFRGVP